MSAPLQRVDFLVIGGGAAGYFGAITAAQARPGARILIVERGSQPLAKVRISGGGRCNVTHACFEPRPLSSRYPRGARALLSAFSRFQPSDTVHWFEQRGVQLKTEPDGRMFPITDDSETIIACLEREAKNAGVELRLRCGVDALRPDPAGGWLAEITGSNHTVIHAQRVLFYETAQTHRASLLAGQADPAVQAIGLSGLGLPQAWYQESVHARAAFLERFVKQHLHHAEFLILPALGCLVPDWASVEIGNPDFDRSQLAGMHAFMAFVNYLGLPALNLPIARDARHRPICVQVLARPFAEHRLLDFAEQAELISRVT